MFIRIYWFLRDQLYFLFETAIGGAILILVYALFCIGVLLLVCLGGLAFFSAIL